MYFPVRHWLIIPALLAAALAPEGGSCGCDSPESETNVQGTATITKIVAAPSTDDNCEREPVRVELRFVSAEGDSLGSSQDERRLLVGPGLNPSRSFVERKGIEVGASYACIEQRGRGPWTYYFVDLDLSDYAADCYLPR